MARRASLTLATMAISKGRVVPMAVVLRPMHTTVASEGSEPMLVSVAPTYTTTSFPSLEWRPMKRGCCRGKLW